MHRLLPERGLGPPCSAGPAGRTTMAAGTQPWWELLVQFIPTSVARRTGVTHTDWGEAQGTVVSDETSPQGRRPCSHGDRERTCFGSPVGLEGPGGAGDALGVWEETQARGCASAGLAPPDDTLPGLPPVSVDGRVTG